MTPNELIKQLLLSYNNSDKETFLSVAREHIERKKNEAHPDCKRTGKSFI